MVRVIISVTKQTELRSTHLTHNKANLLTPSWGERKYKIYGKAPNSLMAFRQGPLKATSRDVSPSICDQLMGTFLTGCW